MDLNNTTVIKEIATEAYIIVLVHATNNKYYILSGATDDAKVDKSDAINDYTVAATLFDAKLKDLTKLQKRNII